MNESILITGPIVFILVHLVIYFIAVTLNNKHLQRHPDYNSYLWGYFTGVVTIVWGIILFIVCLSLLFLNVDIFPINITIYLVLIKRFFKIS